jgi:hypothetical protein
MERNKTWLRELIGRLSMARVTSISHPLRVFKRLQANIKFIEVAVRLAALYHLAAIGIERVVDEPLRGILCLVALKAEMPKTFGDVPGLFLL